MKASKIPLICLLSSVILFPTGCSTVVNAHTQKRDVMLDYVNGQNESASQELESFVRSRTDTGDEVMWRLEAGSLNCIMGQDDRSIRNFERAETLIEDFDERAVVNLREAGAESSVLLTNPNALPYRGWCRDRIMIPVYKAFAYLGKNDERGFQTELFRLRSNQDSIMDKYEKCFESEDKAVEKEKARNKEAAASVNPQALQNDPRNSELNAALIETNNVSHRGYADFLNPFSIFLSAYGYARSGKYQNAIVDSERLCKALPDNWLVKQYHVTFLRLAGRSVPAELSNVPPLDFPLDQKNVLVIFANGRSAALRQISLYIPVIIPHYATVAMVAWPVCEFYAAPARALYLTADGKRSETVKIADMDGILAAEYNRRLPGMLLRVCLSTAVKEIGAYAATRSAARANHWAGAATAVGTGIYKSMFNTADTRTWEILPKEFQIAQISMPHDRKLVLESDHFSSLTITIPKTAGSAIVLVNAPGFAPQSVSCRVFTLKK